MSALVLSQLDYQRGEEKIFLGVNYQFESGKFHLLTGKSGSGKSTMLSLIAGFSDMDYQGKISWQGDNLRLLSHSVRAQRIGFLFQDSRRQFTMRTLYQELVFSLENLSLLPEEIEKRMHQALRECGTEELLHRSYLQLSGGERQNAALTVLLAMQPSLLLLDEPFASMDKKTRYKMIALLGRWCQQGKTVLLVDHELGGYEGVVDSFHQLVDGKMVQLHQDSVADTTAISDLNPRQPLRNSVLRLENFSLMQGKTILLQAPNQIFRQGLTLLTGDNGVGKSTFLRSLVQHFPYQGKVYLAEKKLKKSFSLFSQMTLVLQESEKQFVTTTVAEELGYHQKNKDRQEQALRDLGLESIKNRSLYQLSQGQKKIVQLICMLTSEVPVLLLDEPFVGLDDQVCAYIVNWLEDLAQSNTILLVSHRLSPLVGKLDYHIHLSQRRFLEQEV